MSDDAESTLGTDPSNPDTDGDWLVDGQEIQRGTTPLMEDTDGDELADGLEVDLGTNALAADPVTHLSGSALYPDTQVAESARVSLQNEDLDRA